MIPFALNETFRAYINLDRRTDRDVRMIAELKRVSLKAERFSGLLPRDVKVPEWKLATMRRRSPGHIGCHYSHIALLEKALALRQHAFLMEDDVVFCSDFHDRMKIIEPFLNSNPWDIFFLGGTWHNPPYWHKHGHAADMPQCRCTLGKDFEPTDNPHIVRTYGCFCTSGYLVNVESIPRVLQLMDESVHLSYAVDWCYIFIQPRLFCYAFTPGCVKQEDGFSDIGQAQSHFSRFSRLGPHWFQDKMSNEASATSSPNL